MADTYTQTGRQFGPTSTLAALEDSYYLAKQGAERERRQDATERHDAYNDDFADVLRARIDATYTQANAEELVKVIDTTNNPLKRIVNEVSVLYSRPPVRKLATSEATATWRDILHRANASVVFPRLDCLTNLLNTNYATNFNETYIFNTDNTPRPAGWGTPTTIYTPRFVRLNFTVNF